MSIVRTMRLMLARAVSQVFGVRKEGSLPVTQNSANEQLQAQRFRVRLRVRVARALTTDSTDLSVVVAYRNVSIVSAVKGEPLKKAKWLVLNAGGFETEEAARAFGIRLSSVVELASLSSHLGADVGDGKPTSWVSEQFVRSMGLIKEHERIAPNVHGVSVLPDDDHTRFPSFNAEATVTASPEQLLSAIRELGEADAIDLGAAANGVRLLNLAMMTSEPLAKMVLALSAVEELGQNQKWSESQIELITKMASIVEASEDGTADERAEVANAIRKGLFSLSLRQGVLRLLSRLQLDHLGKEWDRLYSVRSGHFHGTARLSDTEIHKAAFDTVKLCGKIILALVEQQGTRLPSIAATHFDYSTN